MFSNIIILASLLPSLSPVPTTESPQVATSNIQAAASESPEVLAPEFKLSMSFPGTSSEELKKVIHEPMRKEISAMRNRDNSSVRWDGNYSFSVTFYEDMDRDIAKSEVLAAIKRVESNIPKEIIQRGYQINLIDSSNAELIEKLSDIPASKSDIPASKSIKLFAPEFELSMSFPGTSSEELKKVIHEPMRKEISAMRHHLNSTSRRDGNYSLSVTFYEDMDRDIAKSKVLAAIKRVESSIPKEIIQRGYRINLIDSSNAELIEKLSDIPASKSIKLFEP